MFGLDRDPIFGAHSRAMNRMMNSFFPGSGNMFGGMDALMGPPPIMTDLMPFNNSRGGGGVGMGHHNMGMGMGMFGFPDMNQMMNVHGQPGGNSHSFSSVSVMSMGSGPDGRPQVYQASSTTRQQPDGLKETRKEVMDSRSGTKKVQMSRHIGERGHVKEREENLRTGQREDHEELINIDEAEARHFNQEWKHRAYGGIGGNNNGYTNSTYAIEDRSGSGSRHQHQHQHQQQYSRNNGPASSSSVVIEELPPSDDEDTGAQQNPAATASPSQTQSSRRTRIPLVSSSHRRSSPQVTRSERRLAGSKSTKRNKKY